MQDILKQTDESYTESTFQNVNCGVVYLQGSAVPCLKCGGITDDHCIAYLLPSVPTKS